MNIPAINQPKRIIKDNFRDSSNWEKVKPRKDDIIIASCYKAGTTLTQQIINLLINKGHDFDSIHQLSPWIDASARVLDAKMLEDLPSPRFLKSHLPFDALPYHSEWKYLFLVRDARDVGISLFEHCKAYLPEVDAKGNKIDKGADNFSDFWDEWVLTGKPRWEFWQLMESWWQARNLPNVLLIHYDNLIHHKAEEIKRIADFLNLELNNDIIEMVLKYSSLEYMKSHSEKFERAGLFKPKHFINKGQNGRWRNLLTKTQVETYEKIIQQKLDPEYAHWVMNAGSLNH